LWIERSVLQDSRTMLVRRAAMVLKVGIPVVVRSGNNQGTMGTAIVLMTHFQVPNCIKNKASADQYSSKAKHNAFGNSLKHNRSR